MKSGLIIAYYGQRTIKANYWCTLVLKTSNNTVHCC